MIEQIGIAIAFSAFFTESKLGKTGLTVTVDVYRGATQVITAGSATAIGGGLYAYTLASGSVTTESSYYAIFKTATTSVDQQHIPALWTVGVAGVENLDATVASRSTAANLATANASLVKLQAACYDSATLSGSTLTLSNAATMVVSTTGRVTT